MKKIFLLIVVCLLSSLTTMAQEETGFSTSTDLSLGYKNKVLSTTIGYDFGYKIIPGLYIGVGPMVNGLFGNGNSTFAAGGYGKVRYTIPVDFSVRPFIDARTGYAYTFSESSGGMLYAFGLGVRFANKYSVGICCNVSNSKYTTEESYISGYDRRYNKIDHKYYNVPIYKRRDVEHSETNYIPALLFSIDF